MTLETLRHLSIDLPTGQGSGHARLVYWFLLSCRREAGRCWPSDAKIARLTGVGLREVQRALVVLADAGLVEIRHEHRPSWRTHRGRSILFRGHAPRITWPSGEWVTAAWALCRAVRGGDDSRPCGLVELAVGAWLVAAAGQTLAEDTRVRCTLKQLRGLLGAPHGGGWNERLAELEAAAIFRRAGVQWRHGIVVIADLGDALRRRNLDPGSVAGDAVHQALQWLAERHSDPVVYPRLDRLVEMTGLRRDSVRAGLARLSEVGLVAMRRRRVGGEPRGREYLLLDGSPESTAAAARWAGEQTAAAAARWSEDEAWADPRYRAQIEAEAAHAANDVDATAA